MRDIKISSIIFGSFTVILFSFFIFPENVRGAWVCNSYTDTNCDDICPTTPTSTLCYNKDYTATCGIEQLPDEEGGGCQDLRRSCFECTDYWTCSGDNAIHYDGGCSSGSCTTDSSIDCDGLSGWYTVSPSQTRLVSTGECTQKKQEKKECRDYTCKGAGSCNSYSISSTKCKCTGDDCSGGYQWVDTGTTGNKDDDTSCSLLTCPSDFCGASACTGSGSYICDYPTSISRTCKSGVCSPGSCSVTNQGDCNALDGWYCVDANKIENRDYGCGPPCTYTDPPDLDCSTEATTDTDGGNTPLTQGTVTDKISCTGPAGSATCSVNKYTDSCPTTTTLTEYYPNGASYSSQVYTCDSCSSGVCNDNTHPLGTAGGSYIKINNGAKYTVSATVTLNLNCVDAGISPTLGCSQMKISDTFAGIASATAEPYSTSKLWTLPPGDGIKAVYVIFRDVAGNWMPNNNAIAYTIILDTTDPSVGAISPTSAVIDFATTFTTTVSDATSGINSCSFFAPKTPGGSTAFQGAMGVVDAGGGSCDAGESCTASKSHTFTDDGNYGNVYAYCADNAGWTAQVDSVTVLVTSPGCKVMDCTSSSYSAVYAKKSSGGAGMSMCFIGPDEPWEGQVCNTVKEKPFSWVMTGSYSRAAIDKMCPPTTFPDGSALTTIFPGIASSNPLNGAECHVRFPVLGTPKEGTSPDTTPSGGAQDGACWSVQAQKDGVWDRSQSQCVACSGVQKTTSYGKAGKFVILYKDNNIHKNSNNMEGRGAEVFTASDSDLTNNWIENDEASSLYIEAGCSVTVYKDVGFGGSSQTFASTVLDFNTVTGPCKNSKWNDCISSIEVSCSDAGALYPSGQAISPNKCESACGAPTACDDIAPGACIGTTKQKCDGSCNAVNTCGDGETNCGEECDFNNPNDPNKNKCNPDCTVSTAGTCNQPTGLGTFTYGTQSSPNTAKLYKPPAVNEDVFKVRIASGNNGYLKVDLNGPDPCDWDFWVGKNACANAQVNEFRSPTTAECDSSATSSLLQANNDYYITVHRNSGDGSGALSVLLAECLSNDLKYLQNDPLNQNTANDRSSVCMSKYKDKARCNLATFACEIPAPCGSNPDCPTKQCCTIDNVLPAAFQKTPGECVDKGTVQIVGNQKFVCTQ